MTDSHTHDTRLSDIQRFAYYVRCLARDAQDMADSLDTAFVNPKGQLVTIGLSERNLMMTLKEWLEEMTDYRDLFNASYSNLETSCDTWEKTPEVSV